MTHRVQSRPGMRHCLYLLGTTGRRRMSEANDMQVEPEKAIDQLRALRSG
jgi:hypothetical protein